MKLRRFKINNINKILSFKFSGIHDNHGHKSNEHSNHHNNHDHHHNNINHNNNHDHHDDHGHDHHEITGEVDLDKIYVPLNNHVKYNKSAIQIYKSYRYSRRKKLSY